MLGRLITVVMLLGAVGCRTACWPLSSDGPAIAAAAPELPVHLAAPPVGTAPYPLASSGVDVVPRGTIAVQAPSAPAYARVPPRPQQYRRLTLSECRQRAFAATPLADTLTREAAASLSQPGLLLRRDASLIGLVRAFAADELRNRAVADALRDLYSLAAAEAQYDLLLESEQLLKDQLAAAENAVKQGVRDRRELFPLQSKLLQVRSQAAELDGSLTAVNLRLTERLQLPPSPLPLWPEVALQVAAEDVDVEDAIAKTLQYRPDLNILRLLATAEGRTIQRLQPLLAAIHPLLADAEPIHPLHLLLAELRKHPTEWERRWQQRVAEILATRQRQVAAEVRAAAARRRSLRLQATAQQAELDLIERNIAELEQRQVAGQPVVAELATARLERLQLRAALIRTAAEWHQADIDLRQAMGTLIRD